MSDTPFPDCKYSACDLPGQCRAEGKCHHPVCKSCTQLRADLAAANAKVQEVSADAERYQWLKANHLQTGADSWIRTGDDLEEAIDAARAKPQSET